MPQGFAKHTYAYCKPHRPALFSRFAGTIYLYTHDLVCVYVHEYVRTFILFAIIFVLVMERLSATATALRLSWIYLGAVANARPNRYSSQITCVVL